MKCWERLAGAATGFEGALDLTVFLSGPACATTELAANVRLTTLPPVFSTERLSFLTGDIPDHTDIAPYHPRLARRLASGFDVLHTTDAFFNHARTALRVARRHGLPLVNSIHTATPALTRMFTRRAVVRLLGERGLGRFLLERLHVDERAEAAKVAQLLRHQAQCAFALVSRQDDRERALTVLPPDRVRRMRRGIDRSRFSPAGRDRAWLQAEFGVPPEALVVLYVGRLDPSKNICRLAEGVRMAAAQGSPAVLFCAGDGCRRTRVMEQLGPLAFCPGQIEPERLARVYAAADVFAHPSEIEIFGNVVLEALACGLPVLVAERGGMGVVVENGRTGLVVSGEGPESWAGAVLAVGRDPATLAAMRQAVEEESSTLLPSWSDVLAEDLLPVWRAAVEQARLVGEGRPAGPTGLAHAPRG